MKKSLSLILKSWNTSLMVWWGTRKNVGRMQNHNIFLTYWKSNVLMKEAFHYCTSFLKIKLKPFTKTVNWTFIQSKIKILTRSSTLSSHVRETFRNGKESTSFQDVFASLSSKFRCSEEGFSIHSWALQKRRANSTRSRKM